MNLEQIEKDLQQGKNFDKHFKDLTKYKSEVKELLDLCESIRHQERIAQAERRNLNYKGLEVLTMVRSAIKMSYLEHIDDYDQFIERLTYTVLINPLADAGDCVEITEEQYNKKEGKSFFETLNYLAEFINHKKVNEIQRQYELINKK
jgi:hypothetical protein